MPKRSTAAKDAVRKHAAAAVAAAAAANAKPKPGQRARQTATKKVAILKSLAAGATITTACGLVNTDRTTYYDWIRLDHDFAAAAEKAMNACVKSIESAMVRRARSLSAQGGVTAGIFLLKNWRPDDYQDVHRLDMRGTVAVDRVAVLQGLVEGGEAGGDAPAGDDGDGSGPPDA